MTHVRAVIGLVAGGLLVLSGIAHSILGGRQIRADVTAAQVPSDLAFGLEVGWQFGGAAMLVFGIICLAVFAKRVRGERAGAFPAVVIAGAYLAFGAWALVASGFRPFFLVFIVPAALLLVASTGRADRGPHAAASGRP
jgi:hypothetical protein